MAPRYLIILSVLVTITVAQEFVRPDNPEDVSNDTTSIQTRRPLAQAMEPNKLLLAPLLSHISFISQAVQTSAKAARDNSTTPTTTTCNYRPSGDRWSEIVGKYFTERSWGLVDDDCVTDVYGAGVEDGIAIIGSEQQGSDSRSIFDAVVAHAQGLDNVAKTAARNAEKDWADATRSTDFEFSVRTQKCIHDYAGFIRRGGEWFVAERITNDEKDLSLGEGERLFMHEYLRLSDGILINAEMEVKVKDSDEYKRTTTSLTESGGAVTASEFGEIFATDNLAVHEALRAGEHNTQQASDATTPSNIAILALPLAMNVVPVALIADVNTRGMLVYTLLTDVLTTIPLLIKGVEVLLIGVDTNVAVVTRVTGANVEDERNKAGEVWVAECRATGDLTGTGVALIVVALGFMIGGVIAEIVAKKWVKRRGNLGKASAGLVMAGVVGRGVAGGREGGGEKNV